ncbi:MAG: hypothetical protein A3G75_01945 [Verrucomicrobia bacterium RIFCSPLOWO2_12_FULL_64_8]|nr:MAG: hypothetical protein A3G75_01945 [Verrucomicrobia bacterium RIFCSPLOWO2_12_FULL_64_8]
MLDTWASSWLWPFATLGWPDPAEMQKAGLDHFYPTMALVTAPDIIFFWVARMIMAGLEFMRPGEPLERRIPFRHVYFTGIIRDHLGRKMSKSLGNSPDPLDLINKYGADGLRFGVISIAPQGQDIRFAEERIEFGKNFCNKLWNAGRFRQLSGPMADNTSLKAILGRLEPAKFDADDHALLERLLGTIRESDRCLREFEFSATVQALYGFFWNDFCDWYVEVSKSKLQDESARPNCLAIQDLVLRQTLLLLHPFIPFITEELWTLLGYGKAGAFLMRDARLEDASKLATMFAGVGAKPDAAAVQKVNCFKEFVFAIRQLKSSLGVSNLRDIKIYIPFSELKLPIEFSTRDLNLYLGLAKVAAFRQGSDPAPAGAPATVTPLGTAYLLMESRVDSAAEKVRLNKELETIGKHIAATEARLANKAFTDKAPPAVIEGAHKQLSDQLAKKAELERLIAALG